MKQNKVPRIEHASGDWSIKQNILNEVALLAKKLNKTPSSSWLNSHGYKRMLDHIARHKEYGGLYGIQKECGLATNQAEKGTFSNEENVLTILKPICEELGYFPSDAELVKRKINPSSIKYHFKLEYLANKLSFKRKHAANNRKNNKHWDKNNIILDLETIKAKIGRYPSYTDLNVLGRKDLVSAISKKHKGFALFYSELGIPNIGSYIYANDGHLSKSFYELIVDNILFYNNIKHEHESKIFNTKYKTDFKLNIGGEDIYIEIWGFNNKKYNEVRAIKTSIYNQNKATLISIDGADFSYNIVSDLAFIKNKLADFGIYLKEPKSEEELQIMVGNYDSLDSIKNDIQPYIINGKLIRCESLKQENFKLYSRMQLFGGIKKCCEQIGIMNFSAKEREAVCAL